MNAKKKYDIAGCCVTQRHVHIHIQRKSVYYIYKLMEKGFKLVYLASLNVVIEFLWLSYKKDLLT